MISVVLVIIAFYIIKLMQLQIQEGESYRTAAISRAAPTITIPANRGEIVDRYGRPIAVNRMGYDIVFEYAELYRNEDNKVDWSKLNEEVWQLIKILEKNGEEWEDYCPILIAESGVAAFEAAEPGSDEDKELKSQIKQMKQTLSLQDYATAQNCLDTMLEQYDVSEIMDPGISRKLMGVRLNMDQLQFSRANPYTFARDISLASVQEIIENNVVLRGVEVQVVPIREYTDGTIAPHLIGITGPIYAEDYQELKKKGYKMVDIVGKFGIEKAYEDDLRGIDGKKKVLRDKDGAIIEEIITQEPQPGKTVVLTIDSELQKSTLKALESSIRSIAASGVAIPHPDPDKTGTFTGGDCDSGAAVVMNCRTFEVLAAVTYPSFDLNRYYEDYEKLTEKDSPMSKANPLYNRAFQAAYAPGSTFKPAIALAGLQEGFLGNPDGISVDTRFDCSPNSGVPTSIERNVGAFLPSNRNEKQALYCMHRHGSMNVTQAIAESCNIFFYTVSSRIGITRMNDYCRQMGFGVRTGVGLGEIRGVLAGRDDRDSRSENWYENDTYTAAIGQSDNRFTMMQMAVYTSTIANGGTRYEARAIKTIKSFDMSETYLPDTSESPKILNRIEADRSVINAVKAGMLGVTGGDDRTGGTAAGTFVPFTSATGIKVAGKTGSVDTDIKKRSSNAVFIGFAPYEQPEIALAIIAEKGALGSNIAFVARDIFSEYFLTPRTSGYSVQGRDELL